MPDFVKAKDVHHHVVLFYSLKHTILTFNDPVQEAF